MPRIVREVQCAVCGRRQPDEGLRDGRGRACSHCGTSPLASYDYPPDSAFFPKVRAKQKSLREEVDELRRVRLCRRDIS